MIVTTTPPIGGQRNTGHHRADTAAAAPRADILRDRLAGITGITVEVS